MNMPASIKLYTRTTCRVCNDAKKLLTDKNIPYTVIEIGTDVTREEVLERFPGAKNLPLVVVNDEWIGSIEELEKYVESVSNEPVCKKCAGL